MPIVAAKCPNCGGSLNIDNSKDAGICPYCGNAYIVEKAIGLANVGPDAEFKQELDNVLALERFGEESAAYYAIIRLHWKYSNNWEAWYHYVRIMSHNFFVASHKDCDFQGMAEKAIVIARENHHPRETAELEKYLSHIVNDDVIKIECPKCRQRMSIISSCTAIACPMCKASIDVNQAKYLYELPDPYFKVRNLIPDKEWINHLHSGNRSFLNNTINLVTFPEEPPRHTILGRTYYDPSFNSQEIEECKQAAIPFINSIALNLLENAKYKLTTNDVQHTNVKPSLLHSKRTPYSNVGCRIYCFFDIKKIFGFRMCEAINEGIRRDEGFITSDKRIFYYIIASINNQAISYGLHPVDDYLGDKVDVFKGKMMKAPHTVTETTSESFMFNYNYYG